MVFFVAKFITVHPIAVDIFQYTPKRLTNYLQARLYSKCTELRDTVFTFVQGSSYSHRMQRKMSCEFPCEDLTFLVN